jgi:hypothetical protein
MVYLARLRNRPGNDALIAFQPPEPGGAAVPAPPIFRAGTPVYSLSRADGVAEITGPQRHSASAGVQESFIAFGGETGQVQAWPRDEHPRYRGDAPARIGLGCPGRETGPCAPVSRQEGRKPGPAERPDRR